MLIFVDVNQRCFPDAIVLLQPVVCVVHMAGHVLYAISFVTPYNSTVSTLPFNSSFEPVVQLAKITSVDWRSGSAFPPM